MSQSSTVSNESTLLGAFGYTSEMKNLPSWIPKLSKSIAVILAYILLSEIGRMMPHENLDIEMPLVWPAAGLALAMIIRGGYAYLGGILAGAWIWGTFFQRADQLYVLGYMTSYGISFFIVGWLLRKMLNQGFALEEISDVFSFLVCAPFIGALMSSSLGTAVACLVNESIPWSDYSRLWLAWWLGDAMGVIIVAPFLLVWSSETKINWDNRQVTEVFLWLLSLIFFGLVVFGNWAPTDTLGYPLELSIFPIMAWAAIRFGQRGATTGVVILSIMASYELIKVLDSESYFLTQSAAFMWVFVGVISSTSYFLSAILTEVRKREERHAQNEERLRAFIDAMPDIAFVISAKAEYLEVFAPKEVGIYKDPDSLKGKKLFEHLPEDIAKLFHHTVKNTLLEGKPQNLEYQLESEGSFYWYEGRVAPMANDEGDWDRVIWVAYEITERKRAEAALEHRDRLLQGVATANSGLLERHDRDEAIQHAIMAIGKAAQVDRVFIFQNDVALLPKERIFSLTYTWSNLGIQPFRPEWVKDQNWDVIFPGWFDKLIREGEIRGELDEFTGPLKEHLEKLELYSILVVPVMVNNVFWGVICLDRGRHGRDWQASEIAAVKVASGGMGAFIDNKEGEEALKKAKEEADAANAAKSEFLAMMSHEIRTPMNAILGFTDLLSRTQLDESQKDTLSVIGKSGENLLELINNILDFSKIESRGVELETHPFRLETTVFEALEIMLIKAKEKNIKLEYKMFGKCPEYLVGDSHRLRQVILNLVNNAIKFTHEGEVRIQVHVNQQLESESYRVLIEIIDTGIGIPKEKLKRLFQPFSQADSSTTRQYGGTGLGLVICKRLIEKMGGDIQIDSEVGKGSRFYFEINFAETETDDEESDIKEDDTLSAAFAEKYPLNILIVEDDPINRKLFQTLFGSLGFDLAIAEDDVEAEQMLEAKIYDVVFMDVQLPGKSGLEITEALRKGTFGEDRKDTIVYALTAFALPGDKQKCIDAGATDYLSKPVSAVKLKEALVGAYQSIKG